MKIEKLRLRGFTGIKRGLNLDEIEINFSGREGLVAFAGSNGLGKSTILENLHGFNTLASRSGALFNHVCTRNAEKELCFTYNAHQYRTLLKIDCQSGKSEGYIWQDGKSIVNGKIRDYQKKIVEIFGSENLFFNSVFCAQNSQKLSDMTTGQLKALFAEFLRLDRLQEYEETAKQIINVLSGKTSQIDNSIEALKIRIGGVDEINKELSHLAHQKTTQENHKIENSAQISKLQSERENLKAIIATNVVLKKQEDELCAMLREMKEVRENEDKINDDNLGKLRHQYLALSTEIKELEKLLADEAAITSAGAKEQEISNKIEQLTKTVDLATGAIAENQDAINKLERQLQDYKTKKKDFHNDPEIVRTEHAIAQINTLMEQCNAQLSALELRDKNCKSSTCSFIVGALKAKDEIPKLTAERDNLIQQRQARAGKIEAEIAEIEEQLSSTEYALKQSKDNLRAWQETIPRNREALATAKMELNKVKELAAKLPEIAVAKSKMEDREKALEENKKQGASISEAWKARKQILDEQILRQQEKIITVQNQIKSGADAELEVVEKKIVEIETQITENEILISQTNTNIAELQGRLSGMTEAENQLKVAQKSKEQVNKDMAEWQYIKNACGKNGLQAMEIDGAAPLITGYANDLLSRAFGSLYAVKFLTQDEEGKECLDIITIGEDGEEILLDNLSGGQKVWILMALRLAMTLLSKEKGGRNFQTAFFDEMDGSLDSDNAINFVNLYKSFNDIGHFETIFYITHKQECRSLANNVLMFEFGKNPFWQ